MGHMKGIRHSWDPCRRYFDAFEGLDALPDFEEKPLDLKGVEPAPSCKHMTLMEAGFTGPSSPSSLKCMSCRGAHAYIDRFQCSNHAFSMPLDAFRLFLI